MPSPNGHYFPTRRITIFAKDPSVRLRRRIARSTIEVPNEHLEAGPRGSRVQVVDYDSSTGTLYRTAENPPNRGDGLPKDPFAGRSDEALLHSPDFHAMSAYAAVMRTLARFESALGRRVGWGFPGHQIQVAPHAFADANAFYSPDDQALLFGYFPKASGKGQVFSCLAHDIVAHETTHALLDGLRERYADPSSPDQAAFHEGFADIVALLSVFSLREFVEGVLDPKQTGPSIDAAVVTAAALRESLLTGLGREFGQELSGVRGDVLRRSVQLEPGHNYLRDPEFEEPHKRGEVFVAAIMNAFLDVWGDRLKALHQERSGPIDRARTVEEGADVADRLLTICIRALDYCPPTDLQFCDFASSLLTADWEMYPKDLKYHFRHHLRHSFKDYGIVPACKGNSEKGIWDPPEFEPKYSPSHFEGLQRDSEEVFRFIWDNRNGFKLHETAYTRVLSVRPCLRIGADGFALRETVAEYLQLLKIRARELRALDIRKPGSMPDAQEVTLYGGNAMIFDQFGRLKYNIGNSILKPDRQTSRLEYLWNSGFFRQRGADRNPFAAMHRTRMMQWFGGSEKDAADWTAAAAAGRSQRSKR